MLLQIGLASRDGLGLGKMVAEVDTTTACCKTCQPFFGASIAVMIADATVGTCNPSAFRWGIGNGHLVREIQDSKLSKKVSGGGIVGSGSFGLVIKRPKVDSAAGYRNIGPPMIASPTQTNALELRRFAMPCMDTLCSGMPVVLLPGASPQILTAVIQRIMIDVIDLGIALFKVKHGSMHAYIECLIACLDGALSIATNKMPGAHNHQPIIILVVNERKRVAYRNPFHRTSLEKETVPHGELCLLPRQNTDPTRDGKIQGYVAPICALSRQSQLYHKYGTHARRRIA